MKTQLTGFEDLAELESSPNPAWVFDMDHRVIWWANQSGLEFWKAKSIKNLAERDFANDSATAVERLASLAKRVRSGEAIRDSWTLYPLEEPVSVLADHWFVSIPTAENACLLQIVENLDRSDAEALRLLEAARNTRYMVSTFDLEGKLQAENPAAANFRINDHAGSHSTLEGYLDDPDLAAEIISKTKKDIYFYRERSFGEPLNLRVLALTARRGRDPVTGSFAIFVTEEDISEQAEIARKLAQLNNQLEMRVEERTAEIKDQEERYKSLFEHAPDAIIIQDVDDRTIIAANPAAAEVFNLSVEQLLAGEFDPIEKQNTTDEAADEFRATLVHHAWQSVDLGKSTFEITLQRADGEDFPAEVTMVPFPDKSRRLIRSSIIDLTEAKQEQERYRAIFDSAADVIWIADPEERGFLEMNPKAVELFGVTMEAFNDGTYNFWDFSPNTQPNGEDSVETITKYTKEALKGGSPTFEWTFFNVRGESIPCELTLTRFPDPKRALLRASVRNISEKKAAEKLQLTLENQLAQTQKLESLGQLTGGVAHDFNNLLAVILGNMELLADHISDEKQQALIQTAITATERGARITRSMLAFARKSNLSPEGFNLAETIHELNDWIASTLPDNIIVTTDCAPDLRLIKADYAGAERTLLNLIINARDAMPDGGHLIIRADNYIDTGDGKNLSCVRVQVEDTGSGILPEVLSRVFDPFFSTKSMAENSGLGLSMVHGFMKQSGGEVRISSEPNRGTVVELLFPIHASASKPESDEGSDQDQELTQSLSILLVDDQPPVLEVLRTLLKIQGHQVTTAESGDEAAMRFSEVANDFDLLITDIDMPGDIQGPDLARHMKSQNQTLPIILLSGYAPDYANSVAPEDKLLMLQKPVARDDLYSAIVSLTEKNSAQKKGG